MIRRNKKVRSNHIMHVEQIPVIDNNGHTRIVDLTKDYHSVKCGDMIFVPVYTNTAGRLHKPCMYIGRDTHDNSVLIAEIQDFAQMPRTLDALIGIQVHVTSECLDYETNLTKYRFTIKPGDLITII